MHKREGPKNPVAQEVKGVAAPNAFPNGLRSRSWRFFLVSVYRAHISEQQCCLARERQILSSPCNELALWSNSVAFKCSRSLQRWFSQGKDNEFRCDIRAHSPHGTADTDAAHTSDTCCKVPFIDRIVDVLVVMQR